MEEQADAVNAIAMQMENELYFENQHDSLKYIPSPRKDIYYKLIRMFPNKDKNWICRLLIQPPFETSFSDETSLSQAFIEHILQQDETKLEDVPQFLPEMVDEPKNIDDQCKYLQDVFPHADPSYLYQIAAECNNQKAMNAFIEENLVHHWYPTKADSKEREKPLKVKEQYIYDFDVTSFVDFFPDPFAHFEDPNRHGVFKAEAFEYLKNTFGSIKVNIIREVYEGCKYNLSVTAKSLEVIEPTMQQKETIFEENCSKAEKDVSFFQELAFLRNKKKIQEYLAKIREEVEQEFLECQARGILLECQCCFITDLIPSKTVTCPTGHVFCKSCVEAGVKTCIADGVYNIKCFVDGKNEFMIADLKQVLNPNDFEILLAKKQESEILAAGLEGLEYCPVCNIYGYIPPEGDKIFKCLNSKCFKETCRSCGLLNHLPQKCKKDMEADKARIMVEEKMTQALVRICYSCKKSFCKEGGCNHMTCLCGATMCYLCNQISPIKSQHYNRYYYAAPDGRCPMYTDDPFLDMEFVKKVARETKEQLQNLNPELNLDIDPLLRTVAAAHDNNVNQASVEQFFHIRSAALKNAE